MVAACRFRQIVGDQLDVVRVLRQCFEVTGQVRDVGCIELAESGGDDSQAGSGGEDRVVVGEGFPRLGRAVELVGVTVGDFVTRELGDDLVLQLRELGLESGAVVPRRRHTDERRKALRSAAGAVPPPCGRSSNFGSNGSTSPKARPERDASTTCPTRPNIMHHNRSQSIATHRQPVTTT
ncbi:MULTISPECIES: hypothetical protein [Nocardia]|uniref:hypothetical protein n=1 Tax=Nocardia TaxID=1817 RepID=UPI0019157EDD|nr:MULTISPECIES: hypothetical protein [Nocardia]